MTRRVTTTLKLQKIPANVSKRFNSLDKGKYGVKPGRVGDNRISARVFGFVVKMSGEKKFSCFRMS